MGGSCLFFVFSLFFEIFNEQELELIFFDTLSIFFSSSNVMLNTDSSLS